MAKSETPGQDLRRGERVVATVDLPGIPAGTAGKVAFVDGFTWIRYWVRFDNGVSRGSLGQPKVMRPKEYAALLERRAAGLDEATSVDTAAGAADTAAAVPDGGASGPEGRVPAHLLERSKKARERLAASA